MRDDGADGELARWAADLVERLEGDARTPGGAVPTVPTVRATGSGSVIGLGREVVVKVHAARTDPALLRARLRAAGCAATADLLVPPLEPSPRPAQGGRWATLWPRVDVLHPGQDVPVGTWESAAAGLAALHRVPVPTGLPRHGAVDRLVRALERLRRTEDARARDVVRAGRRVLDDLARSRSGDASAVALVHGDWHLGQLAWHGSGVRLIDVDDLGGGDPAWDLGRPAGFWAAGLLDDATWSAFLDAYRRAGGPAVPDDADPWARLDLPARAAVVVAAVRELVRGGDAPDAEGDALEALSSACGRM